MTESPATVNRPAFILRYYLYHIRKRIWLIVLLGVVSAVLSAWKVTLTRPLFQASARVIIEERMESKILPFSDPLGQNDAYVYRNTQQEIIRSRSLAMQVVEELGLENHPEFQPGPVAPKTISGKLKFYAQQYVVPLFRGQQPSAEPEATYASAASSLPTQLSSKHYVVDQVRKRLKVVGSPSTDILTVAFQAYDASLAAQVPNILVKLYTEQAQSSRFKAAQDAIDWLQERVEQMREKVERSALKLELYKKDHGISSLDDRLPGIGEELATLNTKLMEVRAERIELATLYGEMQKMSGQLDVMEWMPPVAESHTIPRLKQAYVALQHDLSKLRQRYGYSHPKVLQAQEELAIQRRRLNSEIRNIFQGTETRYEMVRAREKALVDNVQALRREVEEMNRKAIHYGSLKRDAESDQRLSDLLLTRLKETSLSPEVTTQNNIRVLDEAVPPKRPINIRFVADVTKIGGMGLMLGVLLAVGLGYLDNTVKTPGEAEVLLGFPVIGLIRRYKPYHRHKRQEKPAQESLVLRDVPQSSIAESFRALRTQILLTHSPDMMSQVLLITSPEPNAGKTTIAANLAMAMAQTEYRVLLIDADLRNPSLHKYFDVDEPVGLDEVLASETQALPSDPLTANLSVISARHRADNPSELLTSTRMRQFITQAREHYDMVIIDSPPLMVVSDAVIISPLVDGILMLLRESSTSLDQAQRALAQLANVGLLTTGAVEWREDQQVRLGLVINDIQMRDLGSYGYYDGSAYYAYYREPNVD